MFGTNATNSGMEDIQLLKSNTFKKNLTSIATTPFTAFIGAFKERTFKIN